MAYSQTRLSGSLPGIQAPTLGKAGKRKALALGMMIVNLGGGDDQNYYPDVMGVD